MKAIISIIVQSLPSIIKAFKGMTAQERMLATATAAAVSVLAVFIYTLLVHFFGYETVSQAVEIFGEALDEAD